MGPCVVPAGRSDSGRCYYFAGNILFRQKALDDSIRRREAKSWKPPLRSEWAEPGYQETKSSALLADMLEQAGFKIERKVAGIPTAFTATYGDDQPVIGIIGEFDALPGLSQEAVAYRQPRNDATYGHACGHHLFGVASASAAMALAEQIDAGHIKGTVRYYGCPAEEGGAAKVFMVDEKLFDDCDAVLHWHPASRNAAGDISSMARIAVKFRFRGKAAQRRRAESGTIGLDAVEVTTHAAGTLAREHTPDFTRIHHVITAGERPQRRARIRRGVLLCGTPMPQSPATSTVGSNQRSSACSGDRNKARVDYQGDAGTAPWHPRSARWRTCANSTILILSPDERQFAQDSGVAGGTRRSKV